MKRQLHLGSLFQLTLTAFSTVDASGKLVSELVIAKGEGVHFPIAYMNVSEELWGPDAKQFRPERWLDGELSEGARSIQGHHHVLSFSDGPRFCLGRQFALANFKACCIFLLCGLLDAKHELQTSLSNMVRTYTFDLPRGKDTELGIHPGILRRPKVAGETGPRVPLIVRRLN